MGKLTYKKRTTKRNSNKRNITSNKRNITSNKRNITKRKLLKKGGGDDDVDPIKSVDPIPTEGVDPIVVPIENYDKKSIQQKIENYIKETKITDKIDPMYYLDKIIPLMVANNKNVDDKTEYLKRLITKFLEKNEIPKNMSTVVKLAVNQEMYKTKFKFNPWNRFTMPHRYDSYKTTINKLKNKTNIVSIEMVGYILQSCLYFLEYGDPSANDLYEKPDNMYTRKFKFLKLIVKDILKFFFTSIKIDFNKYINRDINDIKSGFDITELFDGLKSMDEYKLKYFVNSILYLNKKFETDYYKLKNACSYGKLQTHVGKDTQLIIDETAFHHIIYKTITNYSTDSTSTKSHKELTPILNYITSPGPGRRYGFLHR